MRERVVDRGGGGERKRERERSTSGVTDTYGGVLSFREEGGQRGAGGKRGRGGGERRKRAKDGGKTRGAAQHSPALLLQAWPPDLLGPLTALNKHALEV